MAVGVALLVAFVVVELRSSHPLLPLRLVLDRNRGGANLTMIALSAGMVATFLFLIYYMQGILGYGPVKTGFATLPITGAIVIAVTAATKSLDRLGARVIMTAGASVAAGGLYLLSRSSVGSSFGAHVLPAELVFGLGIGLMFTSLQNLALVWTVTTPAPAAR